jgi:hypothetical protein
MTQKLPLLKKGAKSHDFEAECTLTPASNGRDWILKVRIMGVTSETERTFEQNYRREPLEVAQNGTTEFVVRMAVDLLNCKAADIRIAQRPVWTKH